MIWATLSHYLDKGWAGQTQGQAGHAHVGGERWAGAERQSLRSQKHWLSPHGDLIQTLWRGFSFFLFFFSRKARNLNCDGNLPMIKRRVGQIRHSYGLNGTPSYPFELPASNHKLGCQLQVISPTATLVLLLWNDQSRVTELNLSRARTRAKGFCFSHRHCFCHASSRRGCPHHPCPPPASPSQRTGTTSCPVPRPGLILGTDQAWRPRKPASWIDLASILLLSLSIAPTGVPAPVLSHLAHCNSFLTILWSCHSSA